MRHAQRYWLERQAADAVECAMEISAKEYAEIEEDVVEVFGSMPDVHQYKRSINEAHRDRCLHEAARLLVRAEFHHRAMVSPAEEGRKEDDRG